MSVVVASAGASSGSDTVAGPLGGVGRLGLLLPAVAPFLLYYQVPAALTEVALEGSLGAAFGFGTLRRVPPSPGYLLAWLVPFVVISVPNVLSFLLVRFTLGLGRSSCRSPSSTFRSASSSRSDARSTAPSGAPRPAGRPSRPSSGSDPSGRPLESNAVPTDRVV